MLLCLNKNIVDMSYLFHECDSLISVIRPNNSENNEMYNQLEYEINDENNNSDLSDSNNFYENSSKFLTDISSESIKNNTGFLSGNENYNISVDFKLTEMNNMFYGCSSLIELPDISNWDTSKVRNMSNIFRNCKKLKSIPDISNWNTSNVENMSNMFYNCFSLKSLPDLSKWSCFSVKDMNYMFYYCCSLLSLPDISKWNIYDANFLRSIFYINGMFRGCKSLMSLPIYRNGTLIMLGI